MIVSGIGQGVMPPPMPHVTASSCTSGQTYIPPGGKFTAGPMAGQVTSTGACQDPPSLWGSVYQISTTAVCPKPPFFMAAEIIPGVCSAYVIYGALALGAVLLLTRIK